ncbi:beta-lactamase-like protein [Tricladium varicosporioides]|nr:beta-lactamase-like protein [Hymenoscyphus varicosporioides]
MSAETQPEIYTAFEPVTATWQYIIADPTTKAAAIIDSVLDFDPSTSRISTTTADALISLIELHSLKPTLIMETHAHADHLTASHYIQQKLMQLGYAKPKICIGKRIRVVQATFAQKYNTPKEELEHCFDHLWNDDENFHIGELKGTVMHLPGHTPDHVGYRIGSNVFTGDSIFNPDVGSARADFPGGSVDDLYSSVQKLLSLPDGFHLYTGHDYPPTTRPEAEKMKPYSTVEEQKNYNKHVKVGTKKEEFIEWRKERDAQLGEPRLLHQSLQVNIRGGRLPSKSVLGDRFLSIPVKVEKEVLDVLSRI